MSAPHYEPESEQERMKLFDRFCKYHGMPRPHGLAGWDEHFVFPENTVVVRVTTVNRNKRKGKWLSLR